MHPNDVCMLPSELVLSDEGFICPLLAPRIVVEDHPIDRVVRVKDPLRDKIGGGQRRVIQRLTFDARRRLNFVARNYSEGMRVFLTLTCPGHDLLVIRDGSILKNILHAFLKWWSRKFPGSRWLWFMEFQKRGAPHIHIFADFGHIEVIELPFLRRECVKAWIKYQQQFNAEKWEQLFYTDDEAFDVAYNDHFIHGCHLEYIRLPHMVAAYCSKESSKMIQKKVPKEFENVGRFWGHSRNFKKVKPKKYYFPMKKDEDILAGLDIMATIETERYDEWHKVGVNVKRRDEKKFRGTRIPNAAGRDLPGQGFLEDE